MRILIVNTSEQTGGAAVASNRLLKALNKMGVEAKMLVREKETDNANVIKLHKHYLQKIYFLFERLCIFFNLHFRKKHLFEIDIANSGNDITSLSVFKKSDVIHLAWINQGMLSLNSIKKIITSDKAVVWTMHDLWPATSICHYPKRCKRYESSCQHCPILPANGSEKDLSAKIWAKKNKVYNSGHIYFVTCSKWLCKEAKHSSLLKEHTIQSIPNPIDTHFFKPLDKHEARKKLNLPNDKNIILFVSQRVTDNRKGMDLFIEAINYIAKEYPEIKKNSCIAILGGHAEEIANLLSLPTYPLGYVSDKENIRDVYNAASVFVLPTREDNLPNTIMEAMACGVPCVSFKVGGIPEMIDHLHNGYVAKEHNPQDLAQGIKWVLNNANYTQLSTAAIEKVIHTYSERNVAEQYINLYYEALAYKNYKL